MIDKKGPEAAEGIWTIGPINFAFVENPSNSIFLWLAHFRLALLTSSREKNPKALKTENQIRKNIDDKPSTLWKNLEFAYLLILEISTQNNTSSINKNK